MYSVKKSNLFHFLSLLTIIIGSLFLSEILSALQTNPETMLSWETITLLSIVVAQAGLIFIPVLLHFLTHKGFVKESFYKKSPGLFNSMMVILLTFFLIPTVSLLNLISQFFVKNHIAETIGGIAAFPYYIGIVLVAVFPAVFEELSTRFILLNHYRYKPYTTTCIVSGLVFGMIHMNINQFIYAFVLGFLFCFLVQITESIYTSILMHFTLNATTFSIAYLSKDSLATSVTDLSSQVDWASILASVGVNCITVPIAVLIILKLIRYNGKASILKQKPTVLELTLGRKIPEYQIPQDTLPYGDSFNSVSVNSEYIPTPLQPTWNQGNTDFDAHASYEIHQAKSYSAFNWSFWAALTVFLVIVVIAEFLVKFIPQ